MAPSTDDGNPVPPGQVTTTWSLVSGPGPVTFGTPNALSTTSASFTVPGVHTIRLTAFDGEATTNDDVVVTVDPPAGSGTGLLAQYFNDAGSGIYFTALVLTRTDPTIDFDWAAGAPDPAVQLDNFSVRWSGEVMAPVTGTYTFTTASDEGVRLYLDGQLLIDNWIDHTLTLEHGDRIARRRSAIRHPHGLLRARLVGDRQAVVGVPRAEHPDRAAVGPVSSPARQSAARSQRGRRPDHPHAVRRFAHRKRPRRRSCPARRP